MNKGALIARGRTADVYEWGNDRVLKLFATWCLPNWLDYEVKATRAVHTAGLPVPEVGEVVEVDNRRGIVMERVRGPTMMQMLGATPWKLDYYAGMLAELHASVHKCRVPELIPQRFRLYADINDTAAIPEKTRKAVLSVLTSLPEEDTVCHFDFHPMNVIMSEHGPVIIDWQAAAKGDPLSDVACTWLLSTLAHNTVKPPVKWVLEPLRASFYRRYLKHYAQLHPFSSGALETWKIPIVAARLNDNIVEESRKMTSILESMLSHRS